MIGAIVGAAASLGSTIFGGISNARNARRQKRALEREQRENENWFNRRYYEDATQRADAKRLLTRTEDAIKRRNQEAEGVQSVIGGTEENVAAAREQNAKALSDATSSIAAQAEARKDSIENAYRQQQHNITREQNQALAQKNANTAAAVSGAIKTAGNIASAVESIHDENQEKKTKEESKQDANYAKVNITPEQEKWFSNYRENYDNNLMKGFRERMSNGGGF